MLLTRRFCVADFLSWSVRTLNYELVRNPNFPLPIWIRPPGTMSALPPVGPVVEALRYLIPYLPSNKVRETPQSEPHSI